MKTTNHFSDISRHKNDSEIYQKLDVFLSHDIDTIFSAIYNAYVNKSEGSPFDEVNTRSSNNDIDEFYDRVYGGVQGSIKATFYSLDIFLNYTEFLKMKAIEQIKLVDEETCAICYPTDNKITYEFENFITHSQMLIDRLTWFLAYYFEFKIKYFYQLNNFLKEIETSNTRAARVRVAIKKHKDILFPLKIPYGKDGEQEALRNIIEHRKELMIGVLSVSFNQNKEPKLIFSNSILTSNEAKEADKWLIERFNDLINAVQEILIAFFNIKVDM
ncbi:hypothetical protein [Clostridium sp. CF012]|uniref:hypothetical protein n=1 Tax=Clostridium sp. CF012 TaxID=2843319 RepID=UPI001C0D1C0D|nr:hypothetical protein [Clostridium sp. CF012]MBU3145341.1 hypothetical protein [Clostridium sp. CF012]